MFYQREDSCMVGSVGLDGVRAFLVSHSQICGRSEDRRSAASSLQMCKSCCDGLHFKGGMMQSSIIGKGMNRAACYGKIIIL